MQAARLTGSLGALVALIFILDRVYRFLHPVVNLERAALVGASAFVVLLALSRILRWLPGPILGGFAVFCSAFFSVILIQHGYLISQSPLSGVVHVLILAAAFLLGKALSRQLTLAFPRPTSRSGPPRGAEVEAIGETIFGAATSQGANHAFSRCPAPPENGRYPQDGDRRRATARDSGQP